MSNLSHLGSFPESAMKCLHYDSWKKSNKKAVGSSQAYPKSGCTLFEVTSVVKPPEVMKGEKSSFRKLMLFLKK